MHIKTNINLKPYNTFHFDCNAEYFVEIHNIDDLQELIQTDLFSRSHRLILGGGSNILLTKEHFSGIVIKNNIVGKQVIEEDDTNITLRVGGGENRNDFVRWCIDNGYTGIENLVSIPGTVGAAPLQNIGAYGIEIQSVIQSVEAICLIPFENIKKEDILHIDNHDCHFGYRDSIFKQDLKDKTFITHVTFTLQKYTPTTYEPYIAYGAIQTELEKQGYSIDDEDSTGATYITPRIIATTVASIRASKLPDRTQIGTAGSFFKNPVISTSIFEKLKKKFPELTGWPCYIDTLSQEKGIKLSAGQLIDLAGCKGITQGTVGTYNNHALILVHHGGGTGKNIIDLARDIQKKVYDMFGVNIDPEVNYI